MMWSRVVGAVALVMAVAGCSTSTEAGEKPEPAEHPRAPLAGAHEDESVHALLATRVRLPKAVITDAKIRSTAVVRDRLVATIDLPGEVASDPDKTARVSAMMSGRIESVSFKEGQAVKKGSLLAIIKVLELGKAKAAYTATAARAIAARANADRLQALASQRLAAGQELAAANAEADALEAEARAAQEQLRALGMGAAAGPGSQLALRAPVSGVVVTRDAVVGQPVTADQVIATIADLDEVWFLGRVFEKNLSQVHPGAPVEVQLNAYPKERFSGSIEYLSKQIDPTARTVTARIRLQNRTDLLRLGLFGVARVSTGDSKSKPPALIVPRDAVTELGGKTVVFVSQPDGDFDVHEVVLGDGALGKVEIASGLREGEQVVVEGVFTLKSAVLHSTLGEED